MTSSPRALAALLLGGALLVSTAACGSSGSGGPLAPADGPDGWTSHDVSGVRVATPQAWEVVDGTGAPEGLEYFEVRGGPDPSAADAPVLHVTVVGEPERTLAEEVDGIRVTIRAAFGVNEFTKETVSWPGASQATFLACVSEQPGVESGMVTVRSEWLFTDLEDGRRLIAVVSSPEAAFDEAELHAILTTVELPT